MFLSVGDIGVLSSMIFLGLVLLAIWLGGPFYGGMGIAPCLFSPPVPPFTLGMVVVVCGCYA